MSKFTYIILGGGPGLGFYIPGLMIHKKLLKKGFLTEFYTYEELLSDEKQKAVKIAKERFHKNFKFALMAQKMVTYIDDSINNQKLNYLMDHWNSLLYKHFVVFSGFWSSIIGKYLLQVKDTSGIMVDLCHVDSDLSSSWKLFQDGKIYNQIWFVHWKNNSINYLLNIDDAEPKSISDRKKRLLIHGGGWGIGTFHKYIPELINSEYHLDIINYSLESVESNPNENKIYQYLIDPEWNHWELNSKGDHQFPPFKELSSRTENISINNEDYPAVYDIIKNNIAIVSKPGGGTLIDSLSSATPLIVLEPFGEYEKKNGELWVKKGFGITYNDWKEQKYSISVLKELHENLIKIRSLTKDYFKELICNPKV